MLSHNTIDSQSALNHAWLTGKMANDTTDLLPNVREGCIRPPSLTANSIS